MSLAISVAAWYATSVVCTATTREIDFVSKLILTTNQFFLSTICSYFACRCNPSKLKQDQKRRMWILALSFMIGMLSLNLAIGSMHVSLAMTMRATEPLFTLLLTLSFSGHQQGALPNKRSLACLIPIVAGAGLSSLSSVEFTAIGLCLVGLSNVSFATRAIFYKDTKSASGLNSFEMFYYISRNASFLYFGLCCVAYFLDQKFSSSSISDVITNVSSMSMLLINGVCFFLYLQLSVVVLSQVSAITHGVMNSMRRPVTIAASALWFHRDLSNPNKIGICLACLGSMFYSLSQRVGGKHDKKK